jgi:putative DNA primase/helicase
VNAPATFITAHLTAHRVRKAPATPQEYLRSLTWDGKPRLKNWLLRAVDSGVAPVSRAKRRFLQAAGQQFLMAMAMRAMVPGCVFDHLLALVGPQGTGKSRLLKLLAGDFFSDTPPPQRQVHDDALEAWLYEVTELDTMTSKDLDGLKASLSQRSDTFRRPYSLTRSDKPRAFVYAATSNNTNLLADLNKGRRFWLVAVSANINLAYVARHRDQLFAEAWERVENGEQYLQVTR